MRDLGNVVRTIVRDRTERYRKSHRFAHDLHLEAETLVHYTDAWDIRAWRINGTKRETYRFARTLLDGPTVARQSTNDVRGMVALVTHHIDLVLAMLFPPVVPFRIGTRSPKRLRLKAA